MERREFILKSGMLTALLAVVQNPFAATLDEPAAGSLKPVLLPAKPPLENKGGMDIRVWVRSSMTNGVYSSVECAVAPKIMGPPPHYHKELDELMLVLEGTANILIGNEEVEVQAGAWHLRPRMIKHTFWNASDKPLRFIDMYFNQPFEEYLERLFFELTTENGFPDGSDQKNKEMNILNEKFGLVFPTSSFEERDAIVKKYHLK
jgi:mannose-6-phosphate isomerase-like protein (cupin superfamily)